MDVRYSPDQNSFKRLTTNELRELLLIDNLFKVNEINMTYSDIDRSITGSAVPVGKGIRLTASIKEMAASYFTERREIGIINIGATGSVLIDSTEFILDHRDALYIGMGKKQIEFVSGEKDPACFYFVSYPAHKEYPDRSISRLEATARELGSLENSNKRTIFQYIHPGILPTCQIVMGLTELSTGSVWNTFPPHTHQRRSEVYMYFDLDEDSIVLHLMGEAEETRHLLIRNQQAVLSPSWSMHAGCGSKNYSFIWAMGGENQVFDDMDGISMKDIK